MTASGVKVVKNIKGIEATLSNPAVTAELERRGAAIKAAADGMGSATYAMETLPGYMGGRPYVRVSARDWLAKASNAKHNTLLKSLDAGRG